MTQKLRTIALPPEHGSWGLTLEPILLGLLIAPSWAGAGLALGAFGAFLLRWPVKVAQTSRRQNRHARMGIALRFVGLYAVITLLGFGVGIWQAGWSPLMPLLPALPFGLIFFFYDSHNQSRSWQAELAGPVAFSAMAASIALAGGVTLPLAMALWAVLVARAVPSVLYVRARLRLDQDKPHQPLIVFVSHGVAVIGIAALSGMSLLPWLSVAVMVLLLGRALVGLSSYRRTVPVKVIGFTELGWGLLNVAMVAFF
ncbi:MAG: YwiC-like family protein [Okeania sp. SIO3B3]|nr:YwiC-like family protein [Okeania sp. SIO3B3]